MEFNYRNVNEIILEDILSSGLLDVLEADTMDSIEDAICIALSKLPARYIRHHIDFSYSKSLSPQLYDEFESEIAVAFNFAISKIREENLSQDWQ